MVGNTEVELVLTNCKSLNPVCSANSGEAYNTTIEAINSYTITNVQVLMNNVDITSTSYDSATGNISIENVSEKIEIIATAQ